MRLLVLTASLIAVAVPPVIPESAIEVDRIAHGLRVPKAIAIVSAREAIVISDRFTLGRLDLTTGAHRPIRGGPAPITVRTDTAETGIFDVVLHPAFARNQTLFLSTAIGTSERTTVAIMRARLVDDTLIEMHTLLEADALDASEAHYGGSLAVRGGFLFASIGERESGSRVQDLSTHVGKVLRIHDDGRVPADNPFTGRAGARPEIWSYGHRNPQGLAVDESGTLWANEHGPRHGDEVNRLEAGRDYGWPRVSFGWNYAGGAVGAGLPTDKQATAPLWVWTPAIAPSDMIIYSGTAFPAWRGSFLSTSLNNRRHLNRLEWDGERFTVEERLFNDRLGRLRSIAQGVEGWLYLGNDAGEIYRLRPR